MHDPFPLKTCHCIFDEIPEFIKKCRYVITNADSHSQHFKHEQCVGLCALKVVKEHLIRSNNYSFGKTHMEITRNLYQRYLTRMKLPLDLPYSEFPGVKMEELHVLEELFGLSISVFTFQSTSVKNIYPKGIKPSILRVSDCKKSETPNGHIDALRYKDHLMYITDLGKALGDVTCPVCEKRLLCHNFTRHVQSCAKTVGVNGRKPKVIYKDCQEYKPHPGVLEELQDRYNIKISKDQGNIVSLSVFFN